MWNCCTPCASADMQCGVCSLQGTPTVEFSTLDPLTESFMCTGAAITWGSMQVWVVTEAGKGLPTSLSTTVTTPACTTTGG